MTTERWQLSTLLEDLLIPIYSFTSHLLRTPGRILSPVVAHVASGIAVYTVEVLRDLINERTSIVSVRAPNQICLHSDHARSMHQETMSGREKWTVRWLKRDLIWL